METLAAALIGAALLTTAALFLGRLAFSSSRARRREDGSPRIALPGERSCPLCSSVLEPGERVKSELFPGKSDRIMHIFGCAHCWPATPSAPRICPVCGCVLENEGWVVARYFERPERGHVHVLGCNSCRKK
jgi:hypothetical protein